VIQPEQGQRFGNTWLYTSTGYVGLDQVLQVVGEGTTHDHKVSPTVEVNFQFSTSA